MQSFGTDISEAMEVKIFNKFLLRYTHSVQSIFGNTYLVTFFSWGSSAMLMVVLVDGPVLSLTLADLSSIKTAIKNLFQTVDSNLSNEVRLTFSLSQFYSNSFFKSLFIIKFILIVSKTFDRHVQVTWFWWFNSWPITFLVLLLALIIIVIICKQIRN